MRMFLSLMTVASMITVSAMAFAADIPASTTNTAQVSPVTAAPAAVAAPVAVAPAATPPVNPVPAMEMAKPVVSGPVQSELKDGTKIETGLDGSVTVVNVDGTRTPAPDGILTLKDGTTISVKNGNKVE